LKVGLVPHDKLTELLAMALSGDTIQTLRCARQLIGTGIEPQTFVSQLVSHITNILFSEADAVPETSSSTHLSTDKELLQGGTQLSKLHLIIFITIVHKSTHTHTQICTYT
jgi:DNA polymerase III gamma/tau subunit